MNQEVKKYPITVHYNTEVTADMVKKLNPDKVILAVGGHPSVPPIHGIAGKNVVKAEDVLLGKVQVEGNLVVAGGGEVGIETAAYCFVRCSSIISENKKTWYTTINFSIRLKKPQYITDKSLSS